MDNDTEIFVWIGKGATAEERKAAMISGQDYIAKDGRRSALKARSPLPSHHTPRFVNCTPTKTT